MPEDLTQLRKLAELAATLTLSGDHRRALGEGTLALIERCEAAEARVVRTERERDAYRHANDAAAIAIGERDVARRQRDEARRMVIDLETRLETAEAERDAALATVRALSARVRFTEKP